MAFESKDSAVLGVQLKVQELTVKLGDPCVSVSGSTATIDVKEPIAEVRSCTFTDDSAATSAPVVASSRVITGTQVVLTLSAALAVNDAIIMRYVIAE